jgi:membrane-bound ClpP family serine protease
MKTKKILQKNKIFENSYVYPDMGYTHTMNIGFSVLLIALGAILAYAVEADVQGINLQTAGIIILLLGVVALLISLFLSFGRGRRVAVAEQPVQTREVATREVAPGEPRL